MSHLEGAAGIAGLLKALSAMVHSQVPPNLHLASLNPHMDIEDVKFSFPTEAVVELSRQTLRTFGLSSFGFGGTLACTWLDDICVCIFIYVYMWM